MPELRSLPFEREVLIPVEYKGEHVGKYNADFVADEKFIVKLKAITALGSTHVAQAHHYLAATGFQLAILLNFGAPALEHVRVVRDPAEARGNFSRKFAGKS